MHCRLINISNSNNPMKKPHSTFSQRDKILKGLELAYEKLIEFKKSKNSKMVVVREGKIVFLDPDDCR